MYKRAIIPLDGSIVAEGIIPFVLEVAGPLDMDIVLLRVLVPIPPSVIEGSPYVKIEDPEKRRLEAEAYLMPIAVDLRAKGVRVTTMVRRGEPTAEILAGARAGGAGLIARKGRGPRGGGRRSVGP